MSLEEVKSEEVNDKETEVKKDDDLISWQPVARDEEFERHIAKLKAMKKFNEGK